MAGADGGLSRTDLVNQEWDRELARKESLERRGLTVITTSGVLVTLIFAFAGAVAKGHHFGSFNLAEKLMIAVSLFFFLLSGIYGIATNTPRAYGALKADQLRAGAAHGPISDALLGQLIDAVMVSRERNDTKALALAHSIVCQVIAIVLVGGAIMTVII